MKICLNPQGTLGDIRPLLTLGIELKKAGHDIVVCSSPNFEKLFKSYGLEFCQVGSDYQKILKDTLGKPLKVLFDALQKDLIKQFDDLIDTVAKSDAELIIAAGVNSAAGSIAEYMNIPYRHVWYAPNIFRSNYHSPGFIPMQNLPKWMNRSIWWAYDRMVKNVFLNVLNGYRNKLGLNNIDNIVDFAGKDVIICADPIFAPIPPDVKQEYFQTGFWHLEENDELDSELEQFIEAGSPPIYIGFGSMTDPEPEKTRKMLQGVIDSKRFRFVISKGGAELSVDKANENVFFVNYAPHSKLFPRMAAVVHHGGAGTFFTAARSGVPQIIVPHLADNFYWCGKIAALKIGPKAINKFSLTSDKLLAAINEAVINSEFINNAKRIGKDLRKENGLQDAVDYINNLGAKRL